MPCRSPIVRTIRMVVVWMIAIISKSTVNMRRVRVRAGCGTYINISVDIHISVVVYVYIPVS